MDRIQLSLKAAEPLRAVSLLLTPGVSRSSWYLFNQLKKGGKSESTLEPPIGIEFETPGLEIQRPKH